MAPRSTNLLAITTPLRQRREERGSRCEFEEGKKRRRLRSIPTKGKGRGLVPIHGQERKIVDQDLYEEKEKGI